MHQVGENLLISHSGKLEISIGFAFVFGQQREIFEEIREGALTMVKFGGLADFPKPFAEFMGSQFIFF